MSHTSKARTIKFGIDNRAKLERQAKQTFNHAVRRSGGLALTPDGTLAYLDDVDF